MYSTVKHVGCLYKIKLTQQCGEGFIGVVYQWKGYGGVRGTSFKGSSRHLFYGLNKSFHWHLSMLINFKVHTAHGPGYPPQVIPACVCVCGWGICGDLWRVCVCGVWKLSMTIHSETQYSRYWLFTQSTPWSIFKSKACESGSWKPGDCEEIVTLKALNKF